MQYTVAANRAIHSGTGHPMHQQTEAVTTAMDAADFNSIMWSLMEVVLAGGQTGANFDPDNPATYLNLRKAIFNLAQPIGCVLAMATSADPNLLYLGTTWVAFATGRVLVGRDPDDSQFDALGETGGEKTHTLSTAEMPAHKHITYYGDTEDVMGPYPNGVAGTNKIGPMAGTNTDNTWPYTSTEGGGAAHNNLQPYVVVNYWRRTA